MSKILKITRVKSHGPYEHPKPQVFLAFPQKAFDHDHKIFSISPDHSQITLFPDQCFKNQLNLWLVVDSTHVMGDSAEKTTTYDLKKISSLHCREDDGDSWGTYYNYEFSEASITDVIEWFFSKIGGYRAQYAKWENKITKNPFKSVLHSIRYFGYIFANVSLYAFIITFVKQQMGKPYTSYLVISITLAVSLTCAIVTHKLIKE